MKVFDPLQCCLVQYADLVAQESFPIIINVEHCCAA